jgi:hypothetical protein
MPENVELLSFREAFEYLSNKIPEDTQTPVPAEVHDRAFLIKGITQIEWLQQIQEILKLHLNPPDESYENSRDAFIRNFREVVGDKGQKFSDKRIDRIYDTNIRSVEAKGREKQIVASGLPYLVWMHRTPPPEQGGQPRPEHQALDYRRSGLCFRVDDPQLQRIPKGLCDWGCRCTTFAISEEKRIRLGLRVADFPDAETIAGAAFIRSGRSLNEQILENSLNQISDPRLRDKLQGDQP